MAIDIPEACGACRRIVAAERLQLCGPKGRYLCVDCTVDYARRPTPEKILIYYFRALLALLAGSAVFIFLLAISAYFAMLYISSDSGDHLVTALIGDGDGNWLYAIQYLAVAAIVSIGSFTVIVVLCCGGGFLIGQKLWPGPIKTKR